MGTTPPKGKADYLALGDWNAACSVCGRKFKASTMVQLPQGVGGPWGGMTYVCKRDYRPRQPQDFVRGSPDNMSPPWSQPEINQFTSFCTPNGTSAVPGSVEPGCVYPGYLSPSYNSEGE